MASSLQTLISLLSFTVLLLSMANARPPSPGRKTSFSYDFSGVQPTDLTYQGDAHFPSDTTHLRLTRTDEYGNSEQFSIGRVLYANPVLFSDKNKQADFETTVKFIINTNAGDMNPADGLVFFVAPVGTNADASGQDFGVFNSNGNTSPVFAVEFDIYINDDDPRYRHVGIDIGTHLSKAVVEVDDAILGQEVTAVISYSAKNKLISVKGSSAARSFELSYEYDLGTLLPAQVQVGISGTTGMCVANHDVISWSFSSDLVPVKA